MLILTRNIGQKVIINHDIIISVSGVKGNQVRLAFTAPPNVFIHREEIYLRITSGGQGTLRHIPTVIENNSNNSEARGRVAIV